MEACKILLLGSPRFERARQPVDIRLRKGIALVAYLAVEKRRFARKYLAQLLWPEFGQSSALADLRRTLSVIRSTLGTACLVTAGDQVQLDHDSIEVDLDEFHTLSCSGSPESAFDSLERAAALHRGSFLEGFSLPDCLDYDHWQEGVRQSVGWELESLLETLSRAYIQIGRPELGLPHALRWLSLDPLHEPAHRAIMEIHAHTGKRAAAVAQYEACQRALADIGMEPDEHTHTLHEAIIRNTLVAGHRTEPVADGVAGIPGDVFSPRSTVNYRSRPRGTPGARPPVATTRDSADGNGGNARETTPLQRLLRAATGAVRVPWKLVSAAVAAAAITIPLLVFFLAPLPRPDLSVSGMQVLHASEEMTGLKVAFGNASLRRRSVRFTVLFSEDSNVGSAAAVSVFADEIVIPRRAEATVDISLGTDIQPYVDARDIRVPPGEYFVGVVLHPQADLTEASTFNNQLGSPYSYHYSGSSGFAVFEFDIGYHGEIPLDSGNPIRVFIGDRGAADDPRRWGLFEVDSEGTHLFALDAVPVRDVDRTGYFALLVHDHGNDLREPLSIGGQDVAGLYKDVPGGAVYGGFALSAGTAIFPGNRYKVDFALPPLPQPDDFEIADAGGGVLIDHAHDLPVRHVRTFHDPRAGESDVDRYSILLEAGDTITVETFSAGGRWECATRITVFDSGMNWLDGNDDKAPGDNYSRLVYTNLTSKVQPLTLAIDSRGGIGPLRTLGEYIVEFRL